MRRSTALADIRPPLAFAFSVLRLAPAVRVLADGRVLLASGLLAAGVLAFLAVIKSSVFVDEADNVMGACLMARGALPYRDFFSHHFPTPYYALAIFGEPVACSVLAARVVGVVALTLAAAAFAWIARSALVPAAIVLLGLTGPLYYAERYLAETWIIVGAIASLGLLTDAGLRLRGPVGWGIRFVALTLLVSSSPLGLMMTAVLASLLVLGAGRPFAPTVTACFASVLVWPLILALQGTLPAFVEQGIQFNTEIYNRYLDVQLTNPLALLWGALTFARHRFAFGMDWLLGRDVTANQASFAALFELLLTILLVLLVFCRREQRLFRLGVVLLTPLAVSRDGFHLSPYIAIALVACAHLLPPITRPVSRLHWLAVAVLLVAVRVWFFFLPTELGGGNELAESLRSDENIVRYAAPDDAVLFLPIAPQGYLADDRRPGSFYTAFLPWAADIPDAQERLIADIEANKVAVIVMDQDVAIWDRYRLREYAPKVVAHIQANYHPADTGNRRRARVFVRNDPGVVSPVGAAR